MKVFAAAKVNLGLKVLGRRADGFHELDSVVALLGLGDEVTIEKASATTLGIVGDGVDVAALPADAEANLAVRAARLLEREAGRPLPTRIVIRKRIPLGGGLGGGSTDAAATLRGMNDLWGLGLPRARLLALGAALGSDVPLFLLDGTVRMSGRGERVERLPMPSAPAVLAGGAGRPGGAGGLPNKTALLVGGGGAPPGTGWTPFWGAPPHAPAGGNTPCTRGLPGRGGAKPPSLRTPKLSRLDKRGRCVG